MEESEFERRSIRELVSISELIESQMESVGAESVDLHEGVLSLEFPKGTFVLNKHCASRQIWYSSPVSQPAYFDALNREGKSWWSERLQADLRDTLGKDIQSLTGKKVSLKT